MLLSAPPSCPGDEIGRRKGLKIPRPQGRTGSIPVPGTNEINGSLPRNYGHFQEAFQWLKGVFTSQIRKYSLKLVLLVVIARIPHYLTL